MNEQPFTLTLPQELLEQLARQAAELVLEQLQHHPAATSPYMTIPEAAEYARCKRQRIDDLLSAERLRRYKDGRRTLIRRDELDNYLTSKRPQNNPSDRLAGRAEQSYCPDPAEIKQR